MYTVQELDSALSGTSDALTQLYQSVDVDLRHMTGPVAAVADFQPPYFPPPYGMAQPLPGDYAQGPATSMVPRHISNHMYTTSGHPVAGQPVAAPRPGMIPSSAAVLPAGTVAEGA